MIASIGRENYTLTGPILEDAQGGRERSSGVKWSECALNTSCAPSPYPGWPRSELNTLCEAAEAVGANVNDEFKRNFSRYFELIESSSKQFNLTGAKGWERVRDELFIRSLRFLSPIAGGHISAAEWFAGRRVLDVGTGAGIPGLVLKLAVPEMHLTLLDSSQKKTAFLCDVVQELRLTDVQVHTARAEEFAADIEHREAYDLVVSRGVAKLVELAELTLPYASVGGAVMAAKGPNVEEEIIEAEYAANLLGAAPAIATKVSSPGSSSPDTMVYWMKIDNTPFEYPRRNGVPHSRPITRESAHTGPTAH